ncbi:hypothetical protein LEP1GSC041_1740 [Leptospira noguchii str. 2006001870]|nr:hypothetical protein LEP1GSC041_1740 [Leptospira noguchii str. 2006001870]
MIRILRPVLKKSYILSFEQKIRISTYYLKFRKFKKKLINNFYKMSFGM